MINKKQIFYTLKLFIHIIHNFLVFSCTYLFYYSSRNPQKVERKNITQYNTKVRTTLLAYMQIYDVVSYLKTGKSCQKVLNFVRESEPEDGRLFQREISISNKVKKNLLLCFGNCTLLKTIGENIGVDIAYTPFNSLSKICTSSKLISYRTSKIGRQYIVTDLSCSSTLLPSSQTTTQRTEICLFTIMKYEIKVQLQL